MSSGGERGEATVAMQAAVEAKWDSLERDYGAYDEAEFAVLAGGSPIDLLRENMGLLSYERHGRCLYPGWQVWEGEVLDMRSITTPLRDAGWSDNDVIMWLISNSAYTDGEVPPAAVLVEGIVSTGRVEVPATLRGLAVAAANPSW